MPTSKSYADFILEQLSGLPEIASRQMMGEYILYYRDKVIGGIYDDRFLVKPVKAARERMPEAPYQLRRRCCWWTMWTTVISLRI